MIFTSGISFLPSPFSNKFAITILQISICPRSSDNEDIQTVSIELLGYLHLNHFCVVLLLMCNFQCVFLVDSNCTDVLVCLCSSFNFPFAFYRC